MQSKETIFCTEAIEDLDSDTDSLKRSKIALIEKSIFFPCLNRLQISRPTLVASSVYGSDFLC